ncbi:MAG TPA: SEC-C metal-binding domain-containing protein [Pyrinomonadaceae bacterium]|nr:SEC-C metal-binding domain-containing protein [Pyrinomonadaceae bacterium]
MRSISKPRLEIPEDYKTLIKGIEATEKPGFSDVTTTLLDFDVEAMEVILENIRQGRATSLRDGRDHDLTLEFENSSLGLTILVSTNQQSPSIARAAGYSLMRKYQLKYASWILLIAGVSDETNIYDFRYFSAPWRPDAQKEQEVERYRQRKLEQYFAQFGKPGRNDPCPCNSILKYKKCCGNNS